MRLASFSSFAVAAIAVGSAWAVPTASYIPVESYGSLGGEYLATQLTNFPFTPTTLGSGGPNSFESFCLEINEFLTFGAVQWVEFSNAAIRGGIGGGNPDPVDARTQYLYSQFITGNLAGYTYDISGGSAARQASADALQRVIWYIEEEIPGPLAAGLETQFFNDAVLNGGAGDPSVLAMNTYADQAGTLHRQDMLVRVPEPTTLMLVGLGALAALGLRRR